MKHLKRFFKKIIPLKILRIYWWFKDLFTYSNRDSTAYWKKRATECNGQKKVLWNNEEYNELFRNIEKKIIKKFLSYFNTEKIFVLDSGCGIGIVSKMLVKLSQKVIVDAVDFPEMIKYACVENYSDRINYIEVDGVEYYFNPKKKYNLVISSGCFAAITDVEKCKNAILNTAKMVEEGGMILMLDAFHKWSYLASGGARVKLSSRDIINFVKSLNFELIYNGGFLFWPFRVFLSNSEIKGERLKKLFILGEKLLLILGHHLWSDYKILVFRKK